MVATMSRDLVIFGTRQIAEVLGWYFEHESDYRVVAYTVDGAFLKESTFQDRPVVPFEEITQRFPPETHDMFVAISYQKMNRIRSEKFSAAVEAGYMLAHHVSPQARVWDRLVVKPNTFIMEHNVIQPFSQIGQDTILWAGNHIGHHATIGDHCFLASHIVVSGAVSVGDYTFIGVNATLRDGINVGPRCLIGAGALLLEDTQPEQVFMAERTQPSRVPSSRVRI